MKSRFLMIAVAVCLVGAGIWFAVTRAPHDSKPTETLSAAKPVETSEPIDAVVTLSPAKQQAIGIQLTAAIEKEMQPMATVPGRLQYDDTRHIEVKASTSGILTKVLVGPGTVVSEGDVLAVESSPEVGTARADVLRRRAEYELAKQKYEWRRSACEGLRQLVAAVRSGSDPQSIVDKLDSTTLGAYREQVVSAYSRFRLAKSLADAVDQGSAGALSGRIVQERMSERDAAQAALQAVTEQSLFEACQASSLAKLEVDDAERRLKISRQNVEMLLGYAESEQLEADAPSLSLVEVRAPIDGTIEARTYSTQERVQLGNCLFVLANTSRLWVSADIREQQWAALGLRPGQALAITSPAMPDQMLTSTVEFVGREVNPATNAVPLVATINNESGHLRPGQFVRVQLPLGEPRKAVAVPESAVVEHDGRRFVFVPVEAGQFRRVDVTTGIQDEDWTEIRAGLSAGERVVSHGAFELKSELLLEKEE
ncbi:efflux RND transporter periplasmic adaptor subunit [Planctomicrobium piriforme]|uniref:Membrane fusion protein, cobalt-zinc-cadmium efflux system n=1 Tax=Planctomicrobium piriforme TaxID=1576369 RepID=A0A1I3FVC3_9PLAN|nr:efflux RND transporter periplasmic adaptor subunit [Planctomicrobium piriforme]SFI15012.1 membrane fusion protein, cobalt-zinc-cadmium efflux system [Planctomicrobium piriforme]